MKDRKEEQIDKYLSHQMNTKEKNAFEQEMKSDFELAESVLFQQGLMDFIDNNEPELEQKLEKLGNQYFTNNPKARFFNKWWLLLPILLISVIAINYIIPTNHKKVIKQEIKSTTNSTTIQQKKSINTISDKEIQLDEGQGKKIIKESKQPEKNTSSPITDQPIASLNPEDFKPNPTLEGLMQEQMRSDFETTLVAPINKKIFDFKEKILLKIEGNTSAKPPYELTIYNNKSNDFDNGYFILEQEIVSDNQIGDNYHFGFNANIPLQKGLYYLILTQKGGGDILTISKFSVE